MLGGIGLCLAALTPLIVFVFSIPAEWRIRSYSFIAYPTLLIGMVLMAPAIVVICETMFRTARDTASSVGSSDDEDAVVQQHVADHRCDARIVRRVRTVCLDADVGLLDAATVSSRCLVARHARCLSPHWPG